MIECTHAGTKYTVDNNEGMCDGNDDFTDAYYRVVDAYDAALPELKVHQYIYGRVNGLQYMVSHVGPCSFECMHTCSTDAQKPLRMPISMFHHNFSKTVILESQIVDNNLRLIRKAWRQ